MKIQVSERQNVFAIHVSDRKIIERKNTYKIYKSKEKFTGQQYLDAKAG